MASKERGRARAKAKANLERTRIIARTRVRRAKTLVVWVVPSTTPVTSAKQP